MRSTTFLSTTALFAAAALAGIPGLPDCSQSCITNYGGCSQVDVGCICANTPLIAGLACCVSKQCDAADQASVITFANNLCQGFGVTNLPQTASCAPGVSYTGTQALSTSSGSASATSSAATSTGSSSSHGTSSTGSATLASATVSSSSSTSSGKNAAVTKGPELMGLGAMVMAGLMVVV